MAEYLTTDTDLASVANAIRTKGGTSNLLTFPAGFVSAIDAIPAGGAITLLLGAVRPDAELIESFAYDKRIHSDEGVSIPTYSTSFLVLKSPGRLKRITINPNLYDYFVTGRYLSIPEYSTNDIAKGRLEYSFTTFIDEISDEGNYSALIDPTKYTTKGVTTSSSNLSTTIYWASSTGLSWSSADGVYQDPGMVTAGSDYLSIDSPYLRIHGHSSRFAETFYNALTDIRYQYIIDVFRAPKGNLTYDGWSIQQLKANIKSCVESASHKLE